MMVAHFLTGYEARGDHTMRAVKVSQKRAGLCGSFRAGLPDCSKSLWPVAVVVRFARLQVVLRFDKPLVSVNTYSLKRLGNMGSRWASPANSLLR